MTYRNHELLSLARLAPCCMSCGKENVGDVVAAHSNQGRDGKGMGMKASDAAVAMCCDGCHTFIDCSASLTGAERIEMWESAHRKTMRWLIESGHLAVSLTPQAPPKPPPKIKVKIRSGRKLQGRGFEKPDAPRKIASRPFPKRAP